MPLDLPPFVVLSGGDWYVKKSFPTTEKYPDGRRKYIQVKKRCSPETAEFAAELIRQIDEEYAAIKNAHSGPIVTFKTLCDRFLAVKLHSVEQSTYDYYAQLIKYLVSFNDQPFLLISTLAVQNHYRSMLAAGSSSTMVRKVNVVLSMIFEQAIAWEIASRNPTRGVELPKQISPEIKAFDRTAARAIVHICSGDPALFIFLFALETFMRPQEYLALRWSDINLDTARITVTRAVDIKTGAIKPTKTHRGRRAIRFTDRLKAELLSHRSRQAAFLDKLRIKAARPALLQHMKRKGLNYQKRQTVLDHLRETIERFEKEDLVFPNSTGGFRSLNNLSKREFTRLLDLLKLTGQGFTVYSLRHTGISLALASRANIKDVSQRAGHSKASFTMNTYVHVFGYIEEETAELLGNAIYDVE